LAQVVYVISYGGEVSVAEDLVRPRAVPARALGRRPVGLRLLPIGVTDGLLFGLLVLGLLAYLWAGVFRTGHAYDEGFALYGAHRVLLGEVPHRDFWAVYPPGQFYTLAAAFAVFGETLLVERLVSVVLHLSLALAVYLVVAALTSRRAALVPCALVAIWLAAADYFGYAVFPALALSLFGIWGLLQYVATGHARWLGASGAFVALAALYRHDLGLYVAACIGLVAVLAGLLDRATPRAAGDTHPARGTRGHAARAAARALAAYALGALAVGLPVTAYLLWQVPLAVLWEDLIVFPLSINRHISYLAYPQLVPEAWPNWTSAASRAEYLDIIVIPWVRFYAPLLVGVVGLVVAACGARRGAWRLDPLAAAGVLVLAMTDLALFNHALNRFDWMHVLPSSIVAAALASVLLARVPPRWRRVGLLSAAPLAALLALVYVVPPVRTHAEYVTRFSPLVCHAALPRAGCVDLYADEEWALSYVRAHTAPDERIFVGTTTHDRALGSNILFYFLAERESATRYHELVAGVSTTLPVQREIVADLERHGVRYVVLTAAFEGTVEPNASMLSGGVTLLDDYLRAHFRPVAEQSPFTIWERQ
jgi:hypothetical protein